MSYQNYTPPLTTPPVPNPHAPATTKYQPQPVNIPGVLDQTRRLYQPYVGHPEQDKK